jgi:hypothetical protein
LTIRKHLPGLRIRTSRPAGRAKAPLPEVQQLVARAKVELFSSSAITPLAKKYGDARSGTRRALEILKALIVEDDEESVRLPNPPAEADVHGIECDDEQWYIKLYTDVDLRPPYDEILKVVSFHPEKLKNPGILRRRMVVIP